MLDTTQVPSIRCLKRHASDVPLPKMPLVKINFSPWHFVFLGTAFFFLGACSSNKWGGTESSAFDLKILAWSDDNNDLNSIDLHKEITNRILPLLPALDNGDNPILFVRGSVRSDGKGSVMILEGRFLYSEANIPVKVIVMGSISGTSREARKRLSEGVIKDLSEGLVSNIQICNGTPNTWIRKLDSPEADEQILAMMLLKQNAVKRAVPRIISLMNDPRAEVGMAATETAAMLAGPKNVNQIIEIARKSDTEVEARCVKVLSKIGGTEVIAYLEMLAVGHENPQLRELSFNALKRLK